MSTFQAWWINNGALAAPEDIWNAALEEAAKACEEHGDTATAYLIRAMIEK